MVLEHARILGPVSPPSLPPSCLEHLLYKPHTVLDAGDAQTRDAPPLRSPAGETGVVTDVFRVLAVHQVLLQALYVYGVLSSLQQL